MEGLYHIDNFNSARTGPHGFSIHVARPFVDALLKAGKRSDSRLEARLNERLRDSIASDCDRGLARVTFHAETYLLRSIIVGSECACLRSTLPRTGAVVFDPHNIGTIEQDAAILSTWILWFNFVITLTDFKQPWGM